MVSNSPVVITGSAAGEMRQVHQYSHDKPKLWSSCTFTPESCEQHSCQDLYATPPHLGRHKDIVTLLHSPQEPEFGKQGPKHSWLLVNVQLLKALGVRLSPEKVTAISGPVLFSYVLNSE